jgi:hypothetical protein
MKMTDVSSIQLFYEDMRKLLKGNSRILPFPKPWKKAAKGLILGQMETYGGLPELVYQVYWVGLITDEQWDAENDVILTIDNMLSIEEVYEQSGENYMYMM